MKKPTYLVSLVIIAIVTFQSCKSNRASVSCTNIEKFQSNTGVINIPKFVLGKVIILDTVNKKATSILNILIDPNKVSVSEPIDTTEVLTKTAFITNLSGRVSRASQDIKAKVQTAITNNTTFFLTNSFRKDIVNPALAINESSSFQTIKNAVQNNRNLVPMIVSGIIYADKFRFKLKKGTNVDADASIVSVGEFKVEVKYDCEGSIKIDSKQGGIFFKGTFFKLSSSGEQLVFTSSNIDFTEYDLTQAILR